MLLYKFHTRYTHDFPIFYSDNPRRNVEKIISRNHIYRSAVWRLTFFDDFRVGASPGTPKIHRNAANRKDRSKINITVKCPVSFLPWIIGKFMREIFKDQKTLKNQLKSPETFHQMEQTIKNSAETASRGKGGVILMCHRRFSRRRKNQEKSGQNGRRSGKRRFHVQSARKQKRSF